MRAWERSRLARRQSSSRGVELVQPETNSTVLLTTFARRISSFATINLLGDDVVNIGGYDERIQLTNTLERVVRGRPLAASISTSALPTVQATRVSSQARRSSAARPPARVRLPE